MHAILIVVCAIVVLRLILRCLHAGGGAHHGTIHSIHSLILIHHVALRLLHRLAVVHVLRLLLRIRHGARASSAHLRHVVVRLLEWLTDGNRVLSLLREVIMLCVLVFGDDLPAVLGDTTIRMMLIDDLLLDNVFLVAHLERSALSRVLTLAILHVDIDNLLLFLSVDSSKAYDTHQAEDCENDYCCQDQGEDARVMMVMRNHNRARIISVERPAEAVGGTVTPRRREHHRRLMVSVRRHGSMIHVSDRSRRPRRSHDSSCR